jgi:hypothetical protein
MGEIIAPKHVELIGIINKPFIVATCWLSILFVYTNFSSVWWCQLRTVVLALLLVLQSIE